VAISIDPRLPATWGRLRFRLAVQGRRLTIDITRANTRVEVVGDPLRIRVNGTSVVVDEHTAVEIDNP
jgi:trehalose/maltose hydrolase-like predicted phosphorylase